MPRYEKNMLLHKSIKPVWLPFPLTSVQFSVFCEGKSVAGYSIELLSPEDLSAVKR